MNTLLRQTLIAAALGTAMAASAQYPNPPSSTAGTSTNPNSPPTISPSNSTDGSHDNGATANRDDNYFTCLFVLAPNQDACIAREKARRAGKPISGGDGNALSGNTTSSGTGTSGDTSGKGASGGAGNK